VKGFAAPRRLEERSTLDDQFGVHIEEAFRFYLRFPVDSFDLMEQGHIQTANIRPIVKFLGESGPVVMTIHKRVLVSML
jgi:hypothetical protein